MRPTLLLLHGWGFDAHLWDGLVGLLAGYPVVRWERGYFGAPAEPPIDGPVAGIGHSLGAMLLAERLPPGAPLVAINGFDRFAGVEGVAPRVIARMQTRFTRLPTEVLTDFRARCGIGPAHGGLQTERLAADLDLLATHQAPPVPRPVLSLQGEADRILPQGLRDTVFPGAERATQAEGGHLLPLTHAAWCAERIDTFLCR